MDNIDGIVNICTANNMILKKNKLTKQYDLGFTIYNPKFNLRTILNINLYKLVESLNTEYIERIEEINVINPLNEIDVLIFLKPVFKDYNILKCYLCIKIILSEENGCISFKNTDIPYDENKIQGYTRISNNTTETRIIIHSDNLLTINHTFEVNLFDIFPSAMQNIIAKMVKAVFNKVKVFCEKINN